MEPEPTFDESSSSSTCDRRLSRAAREIVRIHLHDAWKAAYASTGDAKYNLDVSEWTVWHLLEETLIPFDSCPLLPSRDIGKDDEEHSYLQDGFIPRLYRASAIPGNLYRDGSSSSSSSSNSARKPIPVLHQCGFCSKNFTSPYYLDRHFDRHHHDHHHLPRDTTTTSKHSSVSKISMICPAESWCRFLSHAWCHDMAMELEPYYGPGSNGLGPDRTLVKTALSKQDNNLEPCTPQATAAATHACHVMIEDCFGDGTIIGRHLNATLCAPRSCHWRLHNMFTGSSVFHLLYHENASSGDETDSSVILAFLGIIVVLVSLIGLYGTRVVSAEKAQLKQPRPSASSKLRQSPGNQQKWTQQQQRPTNLPGDRPPRTFVDVAKYKKS